MRPSAPSPGSTGRLPDSSVVLIDGIDGSGKTSFAGRLADSLRAAGSPVELIHVDDFRRRVSWEHPAGEAAVYWDQYFDLAALENDVTLRAAHGSLVLLEGIFTLRLPRIGSSPLVYLEVDFDVAATRIMRRDTARGRTPEDVRHRIESRYFPAQRRYRQDYSPCDRAAVLIDSTDPAALRVIRCDWSRLPAPAGAALRKLVQPV